MRVDRSVGREHLHALASFRRVPASVGTHRLRLFPASGDPLGGIGQGRTENRLGLAERVGEDARGILTGLGGECGAGLRGLFPGFGQDADSLVRGLHAGRVGFLASPGDQTLGLDGGRVRE
ncbi:hypothetical protein [Streptomyces aureus]|uniref:hypothetical protein n=1 Tax=Streptomyces aureus TaxID=193461 RepID=UPI0005605652|nr:hypothetical protein [Streptomyces aureus]